MAKIVDPFTGDEIDFVDPFAESNKGIGAAFGAGVDKLQELGYRAVKGFTETGENPEDYEQGSIARGMAEAIGQGGALSKWADEGIQRNIEEQSEYEPSVPSYRDIDSVSDLGSYVAEGIAGSLPYMAGAATPVGAFGMAGGLSEEAYDAQEVKDPTRAVVSGAGQILLERLGIKSSLGEVGKSVLKDGFAETAKKIGKREFVDTAKNKHLVRDIFKGAVGEGVTEMGAEALAQWGAGKSIDQIQGLDEAFVGGFLIGGTLRASAEGAGKVLNWHQSSSEVAKTGVDALVEAGTPLEEAASIVRKQLIDAGVKRGLSEAEAAASASRTLKMEYNIDDEVFSAFEASEELATEPQHHESSIEQSTPDPIDYDVPTAARNAGFNSNAEIAQYGDLLTSPTQKSLKDLEQHGAPSVSEMVDAAPNMTSPTPMDRFSPIKYQHEGELLSESQTPEPGRDALPGGTYEGEVIDQPLSLKSPVQQIEDKGIIFAEGQPDIVVNRENKAFESPKAALKSKQARKLKRNGVEISVVEWADGYAIKIDTPNANPAQEVNESNQLNLEQDTQPTSDSTPSLKDLPVEVFDQTRSLNVRGNEDNAVRSLPDQSGNKNWNVDANEGNVTKPEISKTKGMKDSQEIDVSKVPEWDDYLYEAEGDVELALKDYKESALAEIEYGLAEAGDFNDASKNKFVWDEISKHIEAGVTGYNEVQVKRLQQSIGQNNEVESTGAIDDLAWMGEREKRQLDFYSKEIPYQESLANTADPFTANKAKEYVAEAKRYREMLLSGMTIDEIKQSENSKQAASNEAAFVFGEDKVQKIGTSDKKHQGKREKSKADLFNGSKLATTPTGREIEVEYEVVELDSLTTSNDDSGKVNSDYPQELQPRDRTRKNSELQINNIANNLSPTLLGYSSTTSDGAPIVNEDGVVESGNGRTLGLQRAYRRNNASKYKSYLELNGFDTSSFDKPVLVRVRKTQLDKEEQVAFTKESNVRTTLSMSATENAKSDSVGIGRIIHELDNAEIDAPSNRGFVRKFLLTVGQAEQAELVDEKGGLSQLGKRRIEAAILYHAYGDEKLVNSVFESLEDDIKTIGSALLKAAPAWSELKQQGDESFNISQNVVEAVSLLRKSRRDRVSLDELINQEDIFSNSTSIETANLLQLFTGSNYGRVLPLKRIAENLTSYANLASKVNTEAGLFGDILDTPSAQDILENVNEKNSHQESVPDGQSGNTERSKRRERASENTEGNSQSVSEAVVERAKEPLEAYDELWSRFNKGDSELKKQDLIDIFDLLISSESQIKEVLNKLTKAELANSYYRGYRASDYSKSQLVESSYEDIVTGLIFMTTDSEMVGISGIKREDRIRDVKRKLDHLDDSKLQDIVRSKLEKRNEAKKQRQKFIEGIKNPKTLEDFRNAVRAGKSEEFSAKQWADFDKLVADEHFKKLSESETKVVEAVDGEIPFTLQQTTHSKKGHDLYVVALEDRIPAERYKEVNQKAKSLGGYYSRFKGSGAIPGFQFMTESDRAEFVKVLTGDSVEKTKDRKDKTESLIDYASRMEQRANDSLGQSRKTNTAKRAREAGYAIERAESDLQAAAEIKNIAESIRNGKVKYINKLSNGTEYGLLSSLWNRIYYKAQNTDLMEEAGYGANGREYRWKKGVKVEDMVRLAEFPLTRLRPDSLKRIARAMEETKGYVVPGRQLLKLAESNDSDKEIFVKNHRYFEKMLTFLRKHETNAYVEEVAKDFQRLRRMGIPNLPILRAALMEFKSLTSNVKIDEVENETTEALKYADLKGQFKENDFFNTPKSPANTVVSLANLEKGLKVLEPSAGVGHLADAISKIVGSENVTTNEISFTLNGYLKDKGYKTTQNDFLEMEPEPIYDRVVMNPPFSKDQEVKHVRHAYEFLKPGGRLVAITSSMAGERSNKANTEYKEWLEELGAFSEPLPEGSFKDAINPTAVNTKVTVIDKPDGKYYRKSEPSSSVVDTKPKGVPLAQVNKIAEDYIKGFNGNLDFDLVTAETQVELYGPEATVEKYGYIKGAYDPKARVLTLASENMSSAADVRATLRHEILGHYGLDTFSEQSKSALFERLLASQNEPSLKNVWNKIQTDKVYSTKSKEVQAEEVFAYVIENGRSAARKLYDYVNAWLQSALRRVGLAKGQISASELRNLAETISKQIKQGKRSRSSFKSDESKFRTDAISRNFEESIVIPDESLKDQALRVIQDKFQRLLTVQRSLRNVDESNDAYLAEEAFHGKAGHGIRELQINYVDKIPKLMSDHNLSQDEVDLYLIAKHAAERNAYIDTINPELEGRGSGMSNEDAEAILNKAVIEGKAEELESVASLVYEMLAKSRETIIQHGLESQDVIEAWQSQYKYYVPLKGYAKDESKGKKLKSGKGFNIKGRESMKALGRSSLAESPLLHTISDATNSIIRAHKNDVGKTFLKLVKDNPDTNLWTVFTAENPDLRRGKDSNGQVSWIEMSEYEMRQSDDYFKTKVDGKEHFIKIEDELLHRAMMNLGVDQMSGVVNVLSKFTRTLSALVTSWNPEFMISNATRDVQAAVANIFAETQVEDGKAKGTSDLARKVVKDIPKAIATARRAIRDNDYNGNTEEQSELGRSFKEFLENGAKTGWVHQKNVDELAKGLKGAISREGNSPLSKIKRSAKVVADFVHDYNDIVENATRFSAYYHARKQGISQKKAASLAKNLTINFNRKGEVSNTLNAFFMFANASVQGTANMLRALATPKDRSKSMWDPKFYNLSQKLAIGAVGTTVAMANLNRELGGEDEDGVPYYDKVPAHVKATNFVLMLGGDDYLSFPMPYGYNVLAAMGHAIDNVTHGKSISSASAELTMSALGAFSPIGAQSSNEAENALLRTITPTVAKPFTEIALNENFFGGQIYPEQFGYSAEKSDAYLGTKHNWEWTQGLAKWMNDVTGGNEFMSGAIDVTPQSIEHTIKFMGGGVLQFAGRWQDLAAKSQSGKEITQNDVPFLRRFLKQLNPKASISQFYQDKDLLNKYGALYKSLKGNDRKEFLEEFDKEMKLHRYANSIEKQLRELNKTKRALESSSLGKSQKEAKIERIEELKLKAIMQYTKLKNDLELNYL